MSQKYAVDVVPGDILVIEDFGPVLVDAVLDPTDDLTTVVIYGYDPDGEGFGDEFDPDDILTTSHGLIYLWD